MLVSRNRCLLITALAAGIVSQTHLAQAQWWSHVPADFEECADAAEKASTKEAKASALTECNAKFAGRRKPGGGYSYYDFMQNRSFDIAGPNPTPQEQKLIDEQYTAFLDRERPARIAAAVAAGPPPVPAPEVHLLLQHFPQPPRAALRIDKVPLPVEAPNKRGDFKPRLKNANCAEYPISCGFSRLSESIDGGLKKLFSSSQGKDKGS